MEIESIPQAARERIDRIASADLMVGILADHGDVAPAMVRQALEKLPQVPRTVIIQGNGAGGADSMDGTNAADSAPSEDQAWHC